MNILNTQYLLINLNDFGTIPTIIILSLGVYIYNKWKDSTEKSMNEYHLKLKNKHKEYDELKSRLDNWKIDEELDDECEKMAKKELENEAREMLENLLRGNID